MPKGDLDDLKAGLVSSIITIEDLKISAKRVLQLIIMKNCVMIVVDPK